jgi:vancomycin permeability regulator SanA
MTIKILYGLAGLLILASLMFIRADKYFRSGFYGRYLGIMLAVMVGLWLAGSFLIWKRIDTLRLGAAFLRWLGIFSLALVLGMVVEHFVTTALLTGSGSQPRFSILMIAFVWAGGVLLFLGWHLLFLLGSLFFSPGSASAVRVIGFVLVGLIAVAALFTVGINIVIRRSVRESIYSIADVPQGGTAIVFGAGVWSESLKPTAVLQDRIEAAAELFQTGKVDRVLLSGAGVEGGLEVEVMQQTALELGLPGEALLLDPLGVRTYATCRQARDTFGTDNAVLVTQNFHLPRALFLCNSMGVKSVGLSADLRTYSPLNRAIWFVRESLATAYAWVEVTVFNQR